MTLLSIAIPTYKRNEVLKETLSSVVSKLSERDQRDLQIIISDNDPQSDFEHFICEFQKNIGCKIQYHRNAVNLGPDKNFLQCISFSQGSEFVWLLGDDDLVLDNRVTDILRILRGEKPDCIFLECRGFNWCQLQPRSSYTLKSLPLFLMFVNFYTTFLSSFVLRHESVRRYASDALVGSCLIQLGWVFPALKASRKYCVYSQQVFSGGTQVTGGYDFIDVFMVRFWNIWDENFSDKVGVFRLVVRPFVRYMMHVSFYPVIIENSLRDNSRFRFVSAPDFLRSYRALQGDFLFWIFTAPLFALPPAARTLFVRLFFPLRVINCLFLSVFVGNLFSSQIKPELDRDTARAFRLL